jgi:thiamine biosynthesis lipoprotein ApbE
VIELATANGRALGTSLHVAVTIPELLGRAQEAVDQVARDIDECCSRFREDSELTRMNAAAGREVEVSPLMARALAAAVRGAHLSRGAVDPTVGAAVKSAGYSVDFAQVAPELGPIALVVRPVPGWRRLALHEATRRVTVPAGVAVDLGATAKALASDLAAGAAVAAMGAGGVLVSLGGDIAVAGEAPPDGWHIQVADDSDAPLRVDAETIAIRSGGVATSSVTVRRWKRGGTVLHHIIDPLTGLPADGPWRTVTVCAGDCLDANIAATAAIVHGAEAVIWLAAAHLPARLVDHEGAITRTPGWPAPA